MTSPHPAMIATDAVAVRMRPASLTRADSSEWLTACSYCRRVLVSDEQYGAQWVARDLLDRRGELARLQLTHGICPACYHRVVLPLLEMFRRNGSAAGPDRLTVA